MAFQVPDDGDYSVWLDSLRSKVDGSCSAWEFSLPSQRFGHQIFNSLSKPGAAAALENWLAGDGSIGQYLNQRAATIAVIVIGAILLILSVVAAFGLKQSIRNLFSKWFCGACRSRQRPRLREVKPHYRIGLIAFNSVFGTLCLVAAVFAFVGGSYQIRGVEKASCNIWMQLYGHFYGTEKLSRGDIEDVAFSWGGSANLNRQLTELKGKVTPGLENPIYLAMMDGYVELQENSNAEALKLASVIDVASNLTDAHIKTLAAMPNFGLSFRKTLAVGDTVMVKIEVFRDELNKTLVEGYAGIEELIQKYTGVNSTLMSKSATAVVDTLETIKTIDSSIAALTHMWDEKNGLLRGLIIFVGTLLFILGTAVAAATCLSFFSTVRLLKQLRLDVFTGRKDRKYWAWVYALFVVAAGLSALLCGVSYLAAAIGSDACVTIKDGVFERGNWNILGDKILYPEDPMPVPMNTVFDTCLKNDGEGNVAVSLGMDGRIAELSDDVAAAREDVLATRERLLDRKSKSGRVQVLGLAFREVLKSHYRKLGTRAPDGGAGALWFNGTREFHFDNKDYEELGANNFLCVVPNIKQTDLSMLVMNCNDPNIKVASFNRAVDLLNELGTWAHTIDPATKFSEKWCTNTLASYGLPCGTWSTTDGKTQYIDATTTEQIIDGWVADLTASVGTTNQFQNMDRVPARAKYLLMEFMKTETIATTVLSTLSPGVLVDCPDGAVDCTYNEARLLGVEKLNELSAELLTGFGNTLAFVDNYVNNQVIPAMSSLLDDANRITDGANCQFEGTALKNGAVPPLCETAFPAAAMSMVVCAALTVGCGILAVHAWLWYHYLSDLALDYHDSSDQYNEPAFTPMSQRKEFVAYTGLPSNTTRQSPVATREPSPSATPQSPEVEEAHADTVPALALETETEVKNRRALSSKNSDSFVTAPVTNLGDRPDTSAI